MIDPKTWLDLVDAVERNAPLVGSTDHGAHHWRLVAVTGAELVRTVPDADPVVVLLFALFHDSQRETDYVDPEHGPRGAALARRLLPTALPALEPQRLEMLCRACDLHTTAPPTDDPTLGTCWDSDRLNLARRDRALSSLSVHHRSQAARTDLVGVRTSGSRLPVGRHLGDVRLALEASLCRPVL